MAVALQLDRVADELFPDLQLGDVRRDRRFRRVVDAIARDPGASLPSIFPNPSDYHAGLDLFDTPECTHAAILAAHQRAIRRAIEPLTQPLLRIHDTTLFDYSGHTTLAGDLGPIGNGGGRGWMAHQTLVVDPATRVVFGLIGQVLHVRVTPPKNEPAAQKRARDTLGSRLWVRGLDASGPRPDGAAWIDGADRGAAVFEFLSELVARGRRFVVRSKHNRALGTGPTGAKASQRLHDAVRSVPPCLTRTVPLPARAGRAERVAAVSVARVVVRPPHVRKGRFPTGSLELTGVRVWEPDPPVAGPGAGTVDPLEWFLLTGAAADTPESLTAVVDWYAARMQIEEYHKVQKSGTGVENLQVQSVAKLGARVAVLSVIAVALMNLRLAARDPVVRDRPARDVVPALWTEVLQVARNRRPAEPLTVLGFWTELARLGGYQKNPRTHPPGWITLWRGWSQLQKLIQYHQSLEKMT